MRRILVLCCLLPCLWLSSVSTVYAAGISKQQAASIAQSRYPGRVIDVKPSNSQGTAVYRVKILDNRGGVHMVIIDKNTGDILAAH